MRSLPHLPTLGISLLALTSLVNGQSFYVDVTNAVANPQVHLNSPGSYAHHPSYDYTGAGFSASSSPFSPAGQGTYYTPDGFLTGVTDGGLWQSAWLDVLYPDEDIPPHGGQGTVDTVAPGGIAGNLGTSAAIYANGLKAAPVGYDTNGQYLGIGGTGTVSEYAVWNTAMVVASTTTFQYSYVWSPAGATLADGTEVVPEGMLYMGAQLFIDTDTDYSNGITLTRNSVQHTYEGAGDQEWFEESGTFTLAAGTYYWGMSATSDGANPTYIALEGISISPVPEPSGVLLTLSGVALLGLKRRRSAKG